jgi:electron transfer flavoprotein alpha subunit
MSNNSIHPMSTIAVFIERRSGAIKRAALEAITAARSHAQRVIALEIGSNEADVLADYGVDEVVSITHALLERYSSQAVAEAIAQWAKSRQVATLFFGATAMGKELAPRVAVLLEAAYVPDCVELTTSDGHLEAVRPLYAGKVRATVRPLTERAVYSLRPNMFTARPAEQSSTPELSTFTPTLSQEQCRVVVTDVIRNEGKLDVLEADIVVSGGRGMKGPEHFVLIEELAAVLGGAVGASRAVVDAGWRPHSEQVGQTGKTVSPNLYLACGISGAVQHLAGMSSSKVIAAINKDKDAPIFKVADYGIVGDVFEVIPKLIERIRALKQSTAS